MIWFVTVFAVEPVPIFQSPLAQEHDASGLFDHNGHKKQVEQLSYWGSPVNGKPGHYGYDWPVKIGTEILAAGDGIVTKSGDQGRVRCDGNRWVDSSIRVRVLHDAPDGQKYVSMYLHLSEALVKEGDKVLAGQLIGRSGNTGCSTGPHLHFAVVRVNDHIRNKGYGVDPFGWRGKGPDPRVTVHGHKSVWMWKEGMEPNLFMEKRHRPVKSDPQVIITKVRAVASEDNKFPNREFVEIRALKRTSLEGWLLRNNSGDFYAFQPGTVLDRRDTLRLYSGQGATTDGTLYWGHKAEVWNNGGDCVRLINPDGYEVARLMWGRKDSPWCDPSYVQKH